MTTRILALALLAAFTFARAANADTYLDGQSGAEAIVPDGFYGTHMHSKDADLLLKSDTLNAGITVLAQTLTKKDIDGLIRQWPKDTSVDVVSSVAVLADRTIGFARLQGGRIAVFSARPQGIAIGNFVGTAWTDAQLAVVDAVARSIRVQRMERIRFDVPEGFVKIEKAWTDLVFFDERDGRFVVVEKDATDVTKPVAEQLVDAINAGMLGRKIEATVSPNVEALQPGVAQVDVAFTSDGVRMSAVVLRVSLPGNPLWIVAAGREGTVVEQRETAAFVLAKLVKMSKIVVASR